MGRGLNAQGILGVFAAVDFGVQADGQIDDAPAIQRAIAAASTAGGGVVVLPSDADAVAIGSTIRLPSHVELQIPAGCTLKLLPGKNVPLVANADETNGNAGARITGGGMIDGNRAENPDGTWHGVSLTKVTDAKIEVAVESCRTDGIHLVECSRIDVRASATDNGRHGIALVDTSRAVVAGRAWDNGRVGDAGVGDGVNLAGASVDNVLSVVAYDSSADEKRQGYGVREASESDCDRNTLVGCSLAGNLTGTISFVGASSKLVDNAATIATVGAPSTQAFGDAASLGESNQAARLDHKHAMPDLQNWPLVNEVMGWPPYVPDGTDLHAGNLWFRAVGTPSTNPTVVDVDNEGITATHKRAIKVVGDGAGDGFETLPWTYADQPRVKAGKYLSALCAIWCVGGVLVTAKLVNSDMSETTAAAVSAAAWTLVEIPNHLLVGTTCKLQFTASGAGTFYVVPCANIGARGLWLGPRPTRMVDQATVDLVSNVDPNGTWVTLDMTSNTSPLAFRAIGAAIYLNLSAVSSNLYMQRKGITPYETRRGLMVTRTVSDSVHVGSVFDVMLDDAQCLEFTGALAAHSEQVSIAQRAYEEYS